MGGLAYVDALSIHPYNFLYPRDEATPEAAIRVVQAVHQMALIHSNGKPVNIYITEMGYPTYTGKGGVSEDLAADYLARFVLLAASENYIRGVWWYGFKDQGRDSGATTDVANKEHHFGLVRGDLRLKPYAQMYSALSAVLQAANTVQEVNNGDRYVVTLGSPSGARAVEWSTAGGDITTYPKTNRLQTVPLINLSRIE